MFRSVEGEVDEAEFEAKMIETAKQEGFVFNARHYFTKDDELIYFDGRTYSLINQWGLRTTEAMDQLLAEFPESGIRYQVAKQ